ncbi:HpcH/HpaI aldolase family protein [Aquamicrobium zhengzhouense]|uniref:2,4-dihydroxyhept-2-ene-1,7-dioic acid aldolase n=1 Tax=Aquamicrobium zhengzhouense TaxID=2781738 RepID=A0ABS0S862_9HYPH|nr:aldolase/citrate lyase family protein [Aquamicrobium zhengzhouense]MBI1619488.1 2,4-dihydroxyhept-2-ene-1,7-dioic acid aldolase [Aquamicrobium zhengzhouense]
MSLLDLLSADQAVFTAWSGIPDPLTVDALAATAVDAVTLDMQHGGHHEDSILRGIAPILAANKPAIVRIPVGRFEMASRALDFGADAVIAPMVNTVADAEAFAASMKYPPLGQRSWGAGFAMARRGHSDPARWLGSQNDKTLALAMVETREALAILDDILAVPGIDGIFVGPSDFSIAWTNGAAINPGLEDMMSAIEDIGRRTRATNKHAAIYVVDPALSGRYISYGYRLLALGTEQRYMTLGAQQLLNAARASVV